MASRNGKTGKAIKKRKVEKGRQGWEDQQGEARRKDKKERARAWLHEKLKY
jgi:hypothetical protein